MRTLVAAALIALLAGSAFAQGAGGKRHPQPQAKQEKKEDVAKKKAAEKAYNDALRKIPEPKEKLDPWKAMR
jgi:uncharacterized protein YdeI (BOF family)